MPFIPDENTAVLDKPSPSFIPDKMVDKLTPSFMPDKPTASFIPDKPDENIFTDVFKALARGVERIPTGPAKLLTMGGEELKYQATNISPNEPKTEAKKLSPIKQHLYNIGDLMSGWGKTSSQFYEKLALTGKEAPNPAIMLGWKHPFRKVASLAAENLPMLGVAAGVTAVTAGAGAGPALSALTGASTFGPQAAGDFYEEATKAGIPHAKSRDMALLSATSQIGLENIALGQWMKGGALVKRMARTAIAEGPVEEGSQQLFDNALKVVGWKGTSNLWEDMTDGLAESIAAGAVSGAALGSFNPPSFVDIKSDIEADIRREAKKTGASPEATDKVVKLVSTMMDERAKSISDNALDMSPKNIEIVKQELEKSIGLVIPKDVKTYEIKAEQPKPTPSFIPDQGQGQAEIAQPGADLKGETVTPQALTKEEQQVFDSAKQKKYQYGQVLTPEEESIMLKADSRNKYVMELSPEEAAKLDDAEYQKWAFRRSGESYQPDRFKDAEDSHKSAVLRGDKLAAESIRSSMEQDFLETDITKLKEGNPNLSEQELNALSKRNDKFNTERTSIIERMKQRESKLSPKEGAAKGGEIQPYRVAFEIDGKVYEGKRGEIHAQLLDRLPKNIQDRYYKLLKDPDKAGFLSGFVNEEGFQTRGDIEMRTGKTPRIEELSPKEGGVKPEVISAKKGGKEIFYTYDLINGKYNPIEGRPITINRVKAFVHKEANSNKYVVSEVTTGARFSQAEKSQSAAIESAKANLEKVEKEHPGRTNEAIKKWVKEHGKSPYGQQPSTPSGNAMGALWYNDIPIEQGMEYYKLRSFETPELIRLVREVMGKYPDVVKKTGKAAGRFVGPREMVGNARIKIVAELFKQGNEKELGIVIAHEFGHLTDYLPEGTLKRGNIIGRLLTLQSYLKQQFGELNNKELRTELIAVTKYMHPFDEKTVPPSYKSYRLSSKELYAEAISLLLNSPGTTEKMAPTFTKAFFENLDKKMDVKEAYFDLLELLNGERSDVLDALDEDIRRMFAKADPLRTQKLAEKKVATVSTFDKIRLHLDNKYHILIKKIQNLEKIGQFVPIENNPKYLLEEYAMSNNAVYDWLLNMDKVVKNPLTEANVDIIDFGKYLFLKRIIGSPQLQGEDVDAFDDEDKDTLGEMIDASTGKPFKEEFTDRKNIANPLGIQPQRAQEQLDYLKSKIGDEKFAKIEEFAKKFHDLVFKVVTEAVRVGSYNAKVYAERIEPNKDTYVSFGVINYLQNFVSAGVKKQIGTLNEIENPFLTTVMKTISLIKLNEKQRTMNSVRNFLRQYFPSEIQVSKKHRTTGGGVDWTETPGSFKLLEDGRMVSYEIDPYIARSLKYDPYAGEIGQLLNTILGNKIFKDIVITYNPGFALAFNPIRDFKRTYKSLNALGQKTTLLQLLTEYVRAMPASYRRLRGIDDVLIREMIQNKALDIPFTDFQGDDYTDKNTAYNELLKKYQLSKNPDELRGIRKTLLKPVVSVLEFLRFHGSALESVSKIAGYNILKSRDVAPMERAFKTRTYIGTPNFRTKGLSTETTNAIFIFSNIMKEGLKADATLATNPKTRGGYWWATAKIDLLPKLLMVLAAAGLFGEGLKRLFDKASEYDKTNYIIIPVGEIKGKVVYIRIPHDETGRLISSIFWKVANGLQGKPDQLQQIFAFGAGQMPQLTPALAIGTGWIQYLSGQNPYEPFRGGNVLTDTEYKAGGGSALKKMVEWTANEFGLTSFFTYNKDTNSTFESIIQLTPVVNRLIKVSDAGVSQDLRDIKKNIEQERARITLLKRDEFKAGVKKIEQGANPLAILREIKKSVYGDEKIDNQKAGTLLKGFLREYLKEKKDSPYVDALIYASSNEEKKQILMRMRKSTDLKDFKQTMKTLYKFKVITDNTMSENEWKGLIK